MFLLKQLKKMRGYRDLGCYNQVSKWLTGYGKPWPPQHVLNGVITDWHEAFDRALGDGPEGYRFFQKKVALCGFNVVNDLVYYISSEEDLENLSQKWNAQSGKTCNNNKPQDLHQVLSCLIDAINNPGQEDKFRVGDFTLLEQILEGAQAAELPSNRFLGGAAGNTAYVLGHLAMGVDIHCPYHADDLKWEELNESVRYLQFPPQNHCQRIPPDRKRMPLPYKTTIGFQISPGWQHTKLDAKAKQPSRALFIGKPLALARAWDKIEIQDTPADIAVQGEEKFPCQYPQVFTACSVLPPKTLSIGPTAETTMEELESYTVAILGSIGYKQDSLFDNVRKDQLHHLQKANIPIHVELNPRFDFVFLRGLIDNSPCQDSNRWSLSLNQDDIEKINYNELQIKLAAGTAPLRDRFERARGLLDYHNADWIYVHGNEIDIAVWRKSACEKDIGIKLRDGMLFAKGAVVATMIQRSASSRWIPMINDQLSEEGLSAKGFQAVIEFASAFHGHEDALLSQGFCEPDDGHGVAVAPVFWPGVAQYLSATGAGDYSSAVVAAYVW